MSTTEPERPDEGNDDILAAEFVLAALPGPEQAALARRAEIDPAFAQAVADWTERLSPMAQGFSPADPPPAVKKALDLRLFGTPVQTAKPGLWSSLALWRGFTAAGALAVMLLLFLPGPEPAPGVMATLSSQASDVRFMAVYDDGTQRLSVAHLSGAPASGHVFELWAGEDAATPVSLGVLHTGEPTRIVLDDPARAVLTHAGYLAVSVEPPGGSPTGQPSGAVVAAGDLHDL